MIKKYLFFRDTKIECCCYLFVKEYNFETESAMQPVLYSS